MPVSSAFPDASEDKSRPERELDFRAATDSRARVTSCERTLQAFQAAGVRPALLRYAVAVGIVALVTILRVPFGPLLGNSVPFILYFPAVAIAGWFGSFGPGLAATLLSGYCARTWFFAPVGAFSIPDAPAAFRLGVFLLSGALVSYLCGRLHQRTDELERQKQELEAKVKERTQHLERALGDMEAFSYTASHDLRAPLRTVRGYADELLAKHAASLDAESIHFLNRIRSSSDRLDHLISDLLAFAKVSGAKVEMHAVELKALVARILEHPGNWSSPDVTIVCDDCEHWVQAHDTLLQQVLQNLLENAVKFVAPGMKPRIRIWAQPRGAVTRVWVEDNGIGLPPGDRQRLFGLFERGDPTKYAGTGVGLALVDRAVAKMNGRVGVESEPGKGSRFWIELTAAPGAAER